MPTDQFRSKDTWIKLTMFLPLSEADVASSFLFELGASGLEEKDGPAGTIELTAFFDSNENRAGVLESSIRASFPSVRLKTERLEWNPRDESWRQNFKPFAIVPGIVVAPSWDRFSPKDGEKLITLDPGMAFGTGLHATTRLCANAIYKSCSDNPSRISLIDVGCGSAVLSLVAHRLGVGTIAAVDNDPEACRVAKENILINGAPRIEVHQNIKDVHATFTHVVANILLGTLIELSYELKRISKTGALFILSGITSDQIDDLRAHYSEFADPVESTTEEEWGCLVMKRRS